MMRNGEFPRPVQIGRRAVAWRQGDLDAWICTRRPAALPAANALGRRLARNGAVSTENQ